MAIILGKKTVGRLETLQYANKKFWWGKTVIGISAWYGFWAWLLSRIIGWNCIYYCIDFYSPKIAEDWLDRIFIWTAMQVDKFLVRNCEEKWDISERINEGRTEFGRYKALSLIVPLGYPPSYFKFSNDYDKSVLVFVGLVCYGIELFMNEMNFKWLGGDELLPIEELIEEISHCGIGVALWNGKGNAYYGDPGKTKLYLACGIPVITTNNTVFSKIIEQTQAGIVIGYNKEDFKEAVKELTKNYEFYKNNVSKTWRFISADVIFGNLKVLD